MAKITRKTAVIFGGSQVAGPNGIGKFGSLSNGSPAYSLDPAAIMALGNWAQGWVSALVSNFPALEDMNSVDYVLSYQIAYVLQQGIAEYDASTVYFEDSIVMYNGIIYISLIDDNEGTTPGTDSDIWSSYQTPGSKTFWGGTATDLGATPEDNTWNDVCYGNGTYVAVAQDGTHRVMTSPDGVNWTARTASEANSWIKVCYGNGVFVAVAFNGTHRVMTSPDGITWTNQTASQANTWFSVCFGNGIFVAVAGSGTNRVMTSPDGITWTNRTASENNPWRDVIFDNGLFVAVAQSGTHQVMTSPDGTTWTNRTASDTSAWESIAYGAGKYVVVGVTGTTLVMTSPDGITWTNRTASESNQWDDVVFGNGLFVAVSVDGTHRVMTSPDGITWTNRTAAFANSWVAITYGNGLFVAVSEDGTANQIMSSLDAITWPKNIYGLTITDLPILTAGLGIDFIMSATPNAGAAAIFIDGTYKIALDSKSATLAASDFAAAQLIGVIYDGTNWRDPVLV